MSDVQDLFRAQRHAWLMDCRATARKLLTTREEIIIDDVTKLCPRPSYVHKNVTGSVFKDVDFEMCGIVPATKPSSNKRWVMKWRLREEDLSLTMRQVRRARQPEMAE